MEFQELLDCLESLGDLDKMVLLDSLAHQGKRVNQDGGFQGQKVRRVFLALLASKERRVLSDSLVSPDTKATPDHLALRESKVMWDLLDLLDW